MALPEAANEARKELLYVQPQRVDTFGPLEDARVLYCGHTHDGQMLLEMTRRREPLKCPNCRAPFAADDISDLPKNQALQSFADRFAQAFPDGLDAASDRQLRAYMARPHALKVPPSYAPELVKLEREFRRLLAKGEAEGYEKLWREISPAEIKTFLSYKNCQWFKMTGWYWMDTQLDLESNLLQEILSHNNYEPLRVVTDRMDCLTCLIAKISPAKREAALHTIMESAGHLPQDAFNAESVVFSGHLNFVKWLINQDDKRRSEAVAAAACFGQLEIFTGLWSELDRTQQELILRVRRHSGSPYTAVFEAAKSSQHEAFLSQLLSVANEDDIKQIKSYVRTLVPRRKREIVAMNLEAAFERLPVNTAPA